MLTSYKAEAGKYVSATCLAEDILHCSSSSSSQCVHHKSVMHASSPTILPAGSSQATEASRGRHLPAEAMLLHAIAAGAPEQQGHTCERQQAGISDVAFQQAYQYVAQQEADSVPNDLYATVEQTVERSGLHFSRRSTQQRRCHRQSACLMSPGQGPVVSA